MRDKYSINLTNSREEGILEEKLGIIKKSQKILENIDDG
jgi:hypothetical protein